MLKDADPCKPVTLLLTAEDQVRLNLWRKQEDYLQVIPTITHSFLVWRFVMVHHKVCDVVCRQTSVFLVLM